MFSRPTKTARHSLDAKQATPSKKQEPGGLRKERSSPAVVQHHAGDGSLLKAVVSASGQGAQTLLHAGGRGHKALWRTRSVRNKTESYAILQLKGQSNRGVTVQVTFPDPTSTPKQIRLLHGPAVNCAFKPLEAQHSITAIDAQQLQHSLQVAPNIHVQRYLKIEMQGLAVQSTAAGSLHAVSQLDVVQLSALATAAAAAATQLPVPVLSAECAAADVATAAACDEPSADVLMRSPSAHQAEDHAVIADDASSRPSSQVDVQSIAGADSTAGLCRFNSWLSQTRSSLQKGVQSSTKTAAKQTVNAEQHQHMQLPSDSGKTANAVQAQQHGWQEQREQLHPTAQQELSLQHSRQRVEATLASNRQQLLQLQHHLHSSSPNKQHTNPRVLTAAGRPSTLLSMLRHSSTLSGTDGAAYSSVTHSFDSTEASQPASPAACNTAGMDEHPIQGLVSNEHQPHRPAESQAAPESSTRQETLHSHLYPDESAVLLGSVNSCGPASSNGSCSGLHTADPAAASAVAAAQGYAAAAAAGDRCGSSCSVRGPAADTTSAAADADQQGDQDGNEEAAACDEAALQGPQLVDSQSCLHSGGKIKGPLLQLVAHTQLTDRRVQSCPAMDTSVRGSRGSLGGSGTSSSSNGRRRLRLASARPGSKGAVRQRMQTSKSRQKSSAQMLFNPPASTVAGGVKVGVMLSPEVMRQGQLVKQSCPVLTFPRYSDAHSPTKGSWEDLSAVVAATAAAQVAAEAAADNTSTAEHASSSSAAPAPPLKPQQLKRELFASPDQQQTAASLSAEGVAAASEVSEANTTNSQRQQQPGLSPTASLSSAPAGTMGATPYSAASGNNTSVLHALLFGSSCDFGSMSDCHQLMGQALQDSATSGPGAAAAAATAAATYTAGAGAAGGWSMTYTGLMDSPGDLSAGGAVGPGATTDGTAHDFVSSLLASPDVLYNSSPMPSQQEQQQQQEHPTQENAFHAPFKPAAAPAGVHGQDAEAAAAQHAAVTCVPAADSAVTEDAVAPTPQAALPRVGGVVLSPIAESPEVSKGTIAASPGGGADPASISSACKTRSHTGAAQQHEVANTQQQQNVEQHQDLLPRSLDGLLEQQASLSSDCKQQEEQQRTMQMQLQQYQQQQSPVTAALQQDMPQHLQALQALASSAAESDQQQLLLQELAVQSLLEVQAFNASARAAGLGSSANGRKSNTSTPTKKQPVPHQQQQRSTPTKQQGLAAQQQQAAVAGEKLPGTTPTKQPRVSTAQQQHANHGRATAAAGTHTPASIGLSLRQGPRRSLSLAAPATPKKATSAPPTPTKAKAAAAGTGQPSRQSTIGSLASPAKAASVRPGARSAEPYLNAPVRQQQQQHPAAKSVWSAASHSSLRSSSGGSKAGRPTASSAAAVRQALPATHQSTAAVTWARSTSAAAARKSLTVPGNSIGQATSAAVKTSSSRMSAVRTSHVKLDLSGFNATPNAAVAAAPGSSNQRACHINSSRARSISSSIVAVANRSPSKAGRGASKYEQLLKSQYGAVPAVRTSQARTSVQGSLTNTASSSRNAAGAATSYDTQYQPLPESHSEPALGSSKASAGVAAAQQQHHTQHLPECQSEPVLSSLKIADMASEESLCYTDEQLYLPAEAVTAAGVQQLSQIPDCHSEPALGSMRQAGIAAAAPEQQLLPESRSEPVLGSTVTAGGSSAAAHAHGSLLSHSKHWSAAELHTLSTGVRWSQKWSNENSPASSAHASPVKQHRSASVRQQSSARVSSSNLGSSQCIMQLSTDEPAYQLRQAVEAVQALVQHSSRRLEQAGPSKHQQSQSQLPPAQDPQQQDCTPHRELSPQQHEIAAAAIRSGNRRQSPASPDAQTNFFLPKLVQPQLLTPQSAEPAVRQLGRGMAGGRTAGVAAGALTGLTHTPPGLGLASPISASKQRRRELQQDQESFAFHIAEQLTVQQQQQQPPSLQSSLQPQQAACGDCTSFGQPVTSIQDGDVEPGSPVSIGAAVTGAAAAAHEIAVSDTAASNLLPASDTAADAGSCAVRAASPTDLLLNAPDSSCSPATRRVLQPQARSCQMIANMGKQGVNSEAVAASYRLLQNVGTASTDGLPFCSHSAASVAAPNDSTAADSSATQSFSRSKAGGRNTIVVSIEKHTPGGHQPSVQVQQTYQLESHCIAEIVQLEVASGPADSICTSCSMGTGIGMAAVSPHSIRDDLQRQQQEVQSQVLEGNLMEQQLQQLGEREATGAAHSPCDPSHLPALSAAAAGPCGNSRREDPQADELAADSDGTESVQSYRTASSQMGTVWPHNSPEHHHHHHQQECDGVAVGNDTLAGSIDTRSSCSSVNDTGLQHLRTSSVGHDPRASGVLRIGSDEDEQVGGVHLARNFYQRAGQRPASIRQSGITSQLQRQRQGSQQSFGQSSAGMHLHHAPAQRPAAAAHAMHSGVSPQAQSADSSDHSLWDETDPFAAEVSSVGAGTASAVQGSNGRASQQQNEPPHRVRPGMRSSRQGSAGLRNSAGIRTSSEAGHRPGSRNRAIAAGRGLFKEGSGRSILSGAGVGDVSDNDSDIASHNEASSASSGMGPSRLPGTAAAAPQHCLSDLQEGEASSGLRYAHAQQQQKMQETGSSLSFAAMSKQQRSPSPSTAAMVDGSCSGIGATPAAWVSPGPEVSNVAADVAPHITAAVGMTGTSRGPAISDAAAHAAAPVANANPQPAAPSPAPSVSHGNSVSSSCASASGIGGGVLALEVSMNDLGVGEQQRVGPYRCSKDQSPNKSPVKDRSSPPRLRGSKAGAAIATAAAAPDQAGPDSLLDDDVESMSSSQESYAGKRPVRLHTAAANESQCASAKDTVDSSSQHRPAAMQQAADAPTAAPTVLASPLRSRLQQTKQLQVVLPSSPQVQRRSAMCFSPLHAGRSAGARGSLVVRGGTPGKTPGPGLLDAALSQQACAAGVQATAVQPAFQSKAPTAADSAAGDENQSQPLAEQASHTRAVAEGGTPAAVATAGAAKPSVAASASPYSCFAPLHSMLGSGSGRRSSKTQTRVRQEAMGVAEGDEEVTGVRKNLMAEMLRAADGAALTAGYVATAAATVTAEPPDTHEVRDSTQRSGAVSGSALEAAEHSSASSSTKSQQQPIRRHQARPHTAGSMLGKTLNMPTIGVSPGAKVKQRPATSHASCGSSSAGAGSTERQQPHASFELQQQQRRGSDTGSNSTVGLQVCKYAGSKAVSGAAAASQHSETNGSSSKGSLIRHAAVSNSIQLMSHSDAAAMLRAAAATPAPIPNPLAPAAIDPDHTDDSNAVDVHQLPHAAVSLQQAGKHSKQGMNTVIHASGIVQGPAVPSSGSRVASSGSSSGNSAKQQQQQQSQAMPQSPISSAPGVATACGTPAVPAASAGAAAAAAAAGPLSSGLLRRGNSAGSLSRIYGAASSGRPSSPGASAAGRPNSPAAVVEKGAAATVSGNPPGATTAVQQQQHRRPHSPASSDLTAPSSVGSGVGCQQQQRPLSRGAMHADGPLAQHSEVVSGRTATKGVGQQAQDAAAAAPNSLSSPYLQQLEEHSAYQMQQQQQQPPAASPLSSHRHNLQLKIVQQQSSPAKPVSEVSSPMLGSSPPMHSGSLMRPASCLGYAPGAPTTQAVCGTGSFAGENTDGIAAAAAAVMPPAVATAPPQLLGAARRFNSTGGAAAAAGAAGDTVAGASQGGGTARMGKFRHRRTKSDMPELYQPLLSPLESPLHAAMPEDHSDSDLAILAAAAAATATGDQGVPIVGAQPGTTAAAGRLTPQQSALQMGCMPTEPPTSPLGSPLRHGLTSAAAMYRLQQQQLQREASAAGVQQQQQIEAEGTAAVAAALTDLGPSEPELTLKPQQEGIVQAIAAAVAGYEGSMSPRRLARIQQYISGLASVDFSAALSPAVLKAQGLAASGVGTPLCKDADAMDSFNLNNHMNIHAEMEQQQQQQQSLPEPPSDEQRNRMLLAQMQQSSGAAPATALARTNSSSSSSSRAQTSGEVAPNDQQQLHQEVSYSSNHSKCRPIHSRSNSHASHYSLQQESWQQQQVQDDMAAAAAARASSCGPRSSASSSLPSTTTEALMHALAAAAGAGGLQGSALLASLQALPDMPALLAASAETLDIQPSERGLSWQGSRLSQDSQQDAVMQSQGALLGPGPSFHSQGQLHRADAADTVDGAGRPGLHNRGPAGPATAAGMFRRSAHLLAGFAQQVWGPHAVGSVESTAGSNAIGALSRGGVSRGMGVRGSTGSLSHGVQLVHEMAASVEHLAASLDITGPQALQLTQELLLQQLLGQKGGVQQDEQPLTRTTSAAGTSGQQSSRQDQANRQQEQQQQQARGHNPSGANNPQPQLGPLLAGRLAALAALRQLRRSSVGESPDVIGDTRTGLGSSTTVGTSVLAGAIAAAGLGCGSGVGGSATTATGAAVSNVRGSSAAGILGRGSNICAPVAGGAIAAGARTAISSAGGQHSQQPQQQGPMARQLRVHRPQQHVAPPAWQRSSLGGEGSYNDGDSFTGTLSGSRSRRSSGSGGGSRY